ncbi:hypothetical protein [Sphingobacterium sp. LRF_L2]|uniref:hypothetical protein n=1 Tax=Sphingobacterium sp. LRF_L2 TaxID=3369421 RepID=UPI003F60CF2B
MSILFIGMQEIIIFFALGSFLFFGYTIYHAVCNPYLNSNQKLLWIIIILFGSLIGWTLYWILGKRGQND